jgi:hypothetical protein
MGAELSFAMSAAASFAVYLVILAASTQRL